MIFLKIVLNMFNKVSVAILGSTGYVGLELVKILSRHPNVDIVFLGTENNPNISIKEIDKKIEFKNLPLTKLNKDFDFNPHYPENYYGKEGKKFNFFFQMTKHE